MGELRVLITRTADAAGALIEELTSGFTGSAVELSLACVPVRVAAFEQESMASFAVQKLQDGEYDWLTFTSANGVRGFEHLASELGVTASDLVDDARIACVGKATAKALQDIGLHPDFVPEVQDAAHMVADWPEPVNASLATESKVLCVQGANARAALADGLTDLGYGVETLTVYRMEKFLSPVALPNQESEKNDVTELTTAAVLPELAQTQILIATAPSLLLEIFEEFVAYGGSPESFPHVVAIGNTTGEQAQKLGLKVTVAEKPQAVFLTKASKRVADLHFQCAKQPTHTE